MPHQALRRIARQLRSVHSEESPPQVVGSIAIASWGMLVALATRQTDLGEPLNPVEFTAEGPSIVAPREHNRLKRRNYLDMVQ